MLMPLNRTIEADGDVTFDAAVTLKLRTADGTKRKLMMMRGEGPGALGRLAGGDGQRQGIEALPGWFAARAESG
jgi:hypothetical protein